MTDARTEFDRMLVARLPAMRAYARALTRNRDQADDIAQSAAVRMLAGRDRFRAGTNFGAWANVVVRNEFIETLRRAKARPTDDMDALPDAAMPTVPPMQDGPLRGREIKAAFGRLKRDHAHALIRAGIDHASLDEIAAECGVPVGTVKSRVCRGRRALREALERPIPMTIKIRVPGATA